MTPNPNNHIKPYTITLSTLVCLSIISTVYGLDNGLALTPPMGWNSFDSYGVYLHERAALANVEAMAEKLQPFGYEYYVVDNGWFGEYKLQPGTIFPAEKHAHDVNLNEFGYFLPSKVYFPNGLQPIADRCHELGLKFGVHLMRGIPRKAYELNLPIQGTAYTARDVAITDPKLNCKWCQYCYGVDMTHPGGQAWYDGLIQHMVDMGVDFIKYDDTVPYPAEVEAVAKAIRKCGKPITLSLSPGDKVDPNAIDSFRMANMLRVTKDVWDEQHYIDECFAAWHKWQGKECPGFWIDMDMIPFGQLQLMSPPNGIGDLMSKGEVALAGKGVNRWCQLSDAQKRTFITLRALAASPLMMGGDLPSLDDHSLALITNRQMLACNQNGVMGQLLFQRDGVEFWQVLKKGQTDTGWVGVFNRTEQVQGLTVTPAMLGIDIGPAVQVQDVWNNRSFPLSEAQSLRIQLEAHDVLFLAFQPAPVAKRPNIVYIQEDAPFPEDCWGVYSWAGWNTTNVTRANCPLIKGAPIILKWSQVEPESGSFAFDRHLGDKLKLAVENDFYVFLMIWVAPNAPRWLYENGVPEVRMTETISPQRKPRNWTFQYYLDEDYIRYFHRLIRTFGNYIRDLPPALQERILFVQSAEGSTGDGFCYKGDPLDTLYNISRDQWSRFRMDTWQIFKEALTGDRRDMVKPLLVNYDANRESEYNWVMMNLEAIGLKNGMFSHGYHISDTQQCMTDWRRFAGEVTAAGNIFFSRGEQDAEWKVCGWSKQNTQQALYWSAIFATHCGLDMWNVPTEACQGEAYAPAINFFNRYAGQRDAQQSTVAFCALRKGLDAANTQAYPEAIYGKAAKTNVERYRKIADVFSTHGAIQGDPDKATGGGMKNRQRDHYNDVGWGILAGNYGRFLNQIDPESTSVGWWHVDVIKQNCSYADASIYSRFARGFDNAHGKNAMYFDLNDDLFGASNPEAGITFTVIYYDDVPNSTWELQYDNGSRSMVTALAVTNTGSGTWRTLKATVTDATFKNGGPKGADIALVNTDSIDDIFHLIEVELAKKNPGD